MIQFERLYGSEAKTCMDILASFRIQYFREFPYLYEGNMDYELIYLDGFFSNPEACLIIGREFEQPIVVSTSIPLLSDYEIVKSAENIFAADGLRASEFMYFGEIIIVPQHRGQGLTKRIFAQQEETALKNGYTSTCYLAVDREEEHPMWPDGYKNPAVIWNRLGYRKTNMVTDFNWPTIQLAGGAEDKPNPMRFWVKEL